MNLNPRAHGTVLVALDGSPVGAAVLPYAEAIARVTGRSVRLLAVVEREPRGLTPRSDRVADRLEREGRERLEAYVAEAVTSIVAGGVPATSAVTLGRPLDEILREAEQPDVDVVALSTHGRGSFDRWVIGSVADKVMRLSSKPTLLVRPPYIPVPRQPIVLQSVLVPLDGSTLSEAALPLALETLTNGGKLWLVRVEPWRTDVGFAGNGIARYAGEEEFVEMEEAAAQVAEGYLTSLLEQLPASYQIHTRVLRGRPAQTLVDFAFHEHVDLAVMMTHGAGGLRRLVLGSTADYLVRSGVPTLLVRAPAS